MYSIDGCWGIKTTTMLLLKTFLIICAMGFLPILSAWLVITFCDFKDLEKS